MPGVSCQFLLVNTKQAERCPVEEAIDNADIIEFVQQALSSVSPTETEVVIADDEKRHLKLHATRLTDADGSHTGAVIVLTDMTRIRQLQKVRRDFVANVSHELRTPLNAIMGYAEMLQEDLYGPLTPLQKEAMARILSNTGQMRSLASDFLDRAQIEAGKLTLNVSAFSPQELVSSVMGTTKMLARSKNLELTSYITKDVPTRIFGDRQRLYQIMIN